MKIIYEDNHLLVVLKPSNIPVCEDESKDLDLLTYLKKYLKRTIFLERFGGDTNIDVIVSFSVLLVSKFLSFFKNFFKKVF